ncbi:MAG: DUF937 domain-containing protein [Hyphomicrobium sp.]
MNIETVIDEAQGGATIDNLAAAFGVPREKATAAARALTQSLANRIERNTLSRGGVADIVAMLGDARAGRALADPQGLASPEVADAGNGVLDVLIGDKHISRGMAAHAARASGLDAEVVKRMLPAVASLLLGGLQKEATPAIAEKLRAFPDIGDLLPMPGGTPERAPADVIDDPAPPQRTTLPRPSAGGGGGIGGATSGGGVILPMPGENLPRAPRRTPYDDLSDEVRKGGGSRVPSGGSLGGLIRSIFGQLLGFGNRGLLSSLIYLLLSKFGMTILRRILGGVFGRR